MRRVFTIVSILLFLSGGIIGFWAINLLQLWALWLFGLGAVVGSLTSSIDNRRVLIVPAVCMMLILCTIVYRRIPMHTLDLAFESSFSEMRSPIDRLEVTTLTEEWNVAIEDHLILDELDQFLKHGHFKTIGKSGDTWRVSIKRANTTWFFYVHGDSLGHEPGGGGPVGNSQTVFVPSQPGFRNWLKRVVSEH